MCSVHMPWLQLWNPFDAQQPAEIWDHTPSQDESRGRSLPLGLTLAAHCSVGCRSACKLWCSFQVMILGTDGSSLQV